MICGKIPITVTNVTLGMSCVKTYFHDNISANIITNMENKLIYMQYQVLVATTTAVYVTIEERVTKSTPLV